MNAKDFEKRNRAITDCYEPGSTFKIIVGAAVIEEKEVNLNTRFDCSKGQYRLEMPLYTMSTNMACLPLKRLYRNHQMSVLRC